MWAAFLLTHMQNKSHYVKEMLGTKLFKGRAVSDLWQTAVVAHTGRQATATVTETKEIMQNRVRFP